MSQHIDDEKKDFYAEHHDTAVSNELGYGNEKRRDTVIDKDAGAYLHDAADAVQTQKTQGFREAFAQYKPAMIYSIIFSSAIIMEGYDTLLLGQFYAQPAFAKRFGVDVKGNGDYQIPAKWQTGLGCATQIGNILGLQITGVLSEKLGYRPTMLIALFLLTGFLFIQFFAVNLTMLLIGYLLLGFPWGTFQTMTVSYAAEVMPVRLRQYLTTYVNLCWVIGQIISSGVNRALVNRTDQWAYKIPFAIQWFWPIPIFIGIVFAPESPWWLTRKGKFEEAEKACMRLTSRSSGFSQDDAKKQVAMMHHTNELEKAQKVGVQFWHCFKGTNLRRTEIACIVWLIQTTCGSPLMGNATYFLRQAGLSPDVASTLNLIMFVIGGCGTVGSWFIMQPFGRRTLYLWGEIALAVLMLAVGGMGFAANTTGRNYGIGALLIIFTGTYDLTVGPVCYSLVAEIGSTRLRSKTVILARNLYNLGGLVVGFVNPYMLNPDEWNLGPKSALVWLVTGLMGIVWTFFRLPEPKGRTYGELDILFERRVPARLFSKTEVDEFDAAERDAAENVGGTGAFVH